MNKELIETIKNNIGNKIDSNKCTKKGVKLSNALIFVSVLAISSFALGQYYASLLFKKTEMSSYKDQNLESEIQTSQNNKKQKYEVRLGKFANEIDAKDFSTKFGILSPIVSKDKDGAYVVKVKGTHTIKEAISTANAIKKEMKILASIAETIQ
ncbi:hypothetical protein [Candidatus Nesciobacter abundans]|uniref:SPOR domain-containing protein n=1 Tax=Candidatus Nesciobacter abundans TaxID=2601668 RepID=A0A5C0UGJ3_9PROT|nr:hypothetical protein [Candidatus Nesciobacter abundans]QEK39235.1 hypothetical protein FZC36_02255 [Candidatus Nesciobacter abundans]